MVELRKAGLTQGAVPNPPLTAVKQGLWDALNICSEATGTESGTAVESPLALNFLRHVPKPLASALAVSLGVSWTAAEHGTAAQRAALWNAAAVRVDAARVPLTVLTGMARLVGWVRDFTPPMDRASVASWMFGSLHKLLDAGKLLQPRAPGASEEDELVVHTKQSLLGPVFKELVSCVDPGKSFPGYHAMGARDAERAVATLTMHGYREAGMNAIPRITAPADLTTSEPAVFVSEAGDACADCVATCVDELCFFTTWQPAIAEMFGRSGTSCTSPPAFLTCVYRFCAAPSMAAPPLPPLRARDACMLPRGVWGGSQIRDSARAHRSQSTGRHPTCPAWRRRSWFSAAISRSPRRSKPRSTPAPPLTNGHTARHATTRTRCAPDMRYLLSTCLHSYIALVNNHEQMINESCHT